MRPIADLALAPRNDRGLVEFSAEFLVLRPTEPARGNGTLLYEVNNRGNIAILRQLNDVVGRQRSDNDRRRRQRLPVPPRVHLAVVGVGRRRRHHARRQADGAEPSGRHQGRRADHRQGCLRSDRECAARQRTLHRQSRHRVSRCTRRRARRDAHRARPAGRRAPADPAHRVVVCRAGWRRGADRDQARRRVQARADLSARLHRARSQRRRARDGGHPRSHVLSAQQSAGGSAGAAEER